MRNDPHGFSCLWRGLFAAALLTAGCETVPDATEAYQARARSFQAPPGKALLYVLRPAGWYQPGTLAELEFNSRKFGTLSPKTYLCVAVPPGHHELKVVSFFQTVTQSLEVEAGQLYFYEVVARKDLWTLTPMAEAEAREKLPKYRLSGHNTFEAGDREVR
jgi:hypothetical protein